MVDGFQGRMMNRWKADMRMRVRVRVLAAAVLSAALAFTTVGVVEAKPKPKASFPAEIALPAGFQPEGITVGRHYAYVGSLADGDIYRADLRTGSGIVVSKAPGTPSVGLKYAGGLLYVAGGPVGTGRLVNATTGEILASYTFTTESSFINDVVLTPKKAWFTNSLAAELYAVDRKKIRSTKQAATVTTLPITGEWQQEPGFNANGIAETPNHKALLVIQSGTGTLFRVNKRSGVATKVDLGGASLPNGDGLLVRGRTLYVVQNRLNKVAVVRLNANGTKGMIVNTLTSSAFDVPTTVAAFRGSLYLPNARFGISNPKAAAYSVVRIRR